MKKSIIEDRNTEVDKSTKVAFTNRTNKIDDNKEPLKAILSDSFLKSGDKTKDEFNIKEALLHLEKNSLLTPFYPIETHRKSILGKGIVWLKRTILKMMLRFDISLKYQNEFNLSLTKLIRQLVDETDLMESRLKKQQNIINDLKKKLKEQTGA